MFEAKDKALILQRLRDRGFAVSSWCRRVGVSRRYFHYVLDGQRAAAVGGPQAAKIQQALKEDGIWPVGDAA